MHWVLCPGSAELGPRTFVERALARESEDLPPPRIGNVPSFPQASREGIVGDSTGVFRLVYRSTPTRIMDDCERMRLFGSAQLRNVRDRISGALVLTDAQYYQWLEGPRTAVERLYGQIRGDRRHRSVETVHVAEDKQRRFASWSMLDASSKPTLTVFGPAKGDAGVVVERMICDPALEFDRLATHAVRHPPPATLSVANTALAPWANSALMLRGPGRQARRRAYILELQRLNVEAYSLGTAWADDRIGSTQVTLGYVQLLEEARRLHHRSAVNAGVSRAPRVLVASMPGEPHVLRARLDAMLLEAIGWSVEYALPETPHALCALVAREPFDAVEIASSSIFSRYEQVDQVQELLQRAARVACKPRLARISAGRLEDEAAGPHSYVRPQLMV